MARPLTYRYRGARPCAHRAVPALCQRAAHAAQAARIICAPHRPHSPRDASPHSHPRSHRSPLLPDRDAGPGRSCHAPLRCSRVRTAVKRRATRSHSCFRSWCDSPRRPPRCACFAPIFTRSLARQPCRPEGGDWRTARRARRMARIAAPASKTAGWARGVPLENCAGRWRSAEVRDTCVRAQRRDGGAGAILGGVGGCAAERGAGCEGGGRRRRWKQLEEHGRARRGRTGERASGRPRRWAAPWRPMGAPGGAVAAHGGTGRAKRGGPQFSCQVLGIAPV